MVYWQLHYETFEDLYPRICLDGMEELRAVPPATNF